MNQGLYWFPPAPADFRTLCSELADRADPPDGACIQRLSGCALDGPKLHLLAKAFGRAVVRHGVPKGLVPLRLGILSNATSDFFAPAITASSLRHGLAVDVVAGRYGQPLQDAVDPDSPINRAKCDVVLVALDHRGLPLNVSPGQDHVGQVDSALDFLGQIREGLRRYSAASVVFQTVPAPPEPIFGNLDAVTGGTLRAALADFNAGLRDVVRRGTGDFLLDVEALASDVGLLQWHDPTQWHLAKLPFSQHAMPLFAEYLARLLGAIRGKSRKCLVLDLDDTIWGGVIGDDGLAGITLGNGSPLGEAFLDVQRTALALRERGILLAVCSKNDSAVAMQPFREHPEMLLREDHLAAFVANWSDKATNLERIAGQLNIGVDSLVLLDDNPAEREQVRQALPGVGVPELPRDPSLYGRTLLRAGYFESVAFSPEDRERAAHYTANAKRDQMRAGSRDLGSFLQSLEMVATVGPFTPVSRARIAQLVNKSNQFNLTTRRYSEADIGRMEDDPSILTMQVRLADRFGDNGIIGVLICRSVGDAWDIDTWLMSCRVLGRGVENVVLGELVDAARRAGKTSLIGHFIPSGRNDMVRDHYSRLGFQPLDANADEPTSWRLAVADHAAEPMPFTVVREGPLATPTTDALPAS